MEAPKAYSQQDPPKPMKIVTMDCRGLEFVEFKADVSYCLSNHRSHKTDTFEGRMEGCGCGVWDEVLWHRSDRWRVV